jgi:hypothetical protein
MDEVPRSRRIFDGRMAATVVVADERCAVLMQVTAWPG